MGKNEDKARAGREDHRNEALREYRRKRDFARTPEPSGDSSEGPRSEAATDTGDDRGGPLGDGQGWTYLVQKHAASRLHYDLRLELDGVLLSWAVPKGPSLDPEDKRFAVRTEDHPLEYGDFEGVIPAGEYGGGTMLLWDRGHWLPNKLDPKPGKGGWEGGAAGTPQAARSGLGKGHLHFHLAGEKLRGGWHLIQMHGERSDDGKNWLLVKEEDDEARPGGPAIVDQQPESVASGRSLEEIAADPESTPSSTEGARAEVANSAVGDPEGDAEPRHPSAEAASGAQRGPMPQIKPQLPRRVDVLPSGGDWLHEIKHDGYRLLASLAPGPAGAGDGDAASPRVRLITRGGQDWTERFRPLAEALAGLPVKSAVLDGEAVALAEDGRSDFSTLQKALSLDRHEVLALYLFDLLYLDGWDLTAVPLVERKALLQNLLAKEEEPSVLRYSEHLPGRGSEVLEHACRLGLEGVVSKRGDRPYRPGRSDDWRKARCRLRQELVIGGWAESEARGIRSLLVGYYPVGTDSGGTGAGGTGVGGTGVGRTDTAPGGGTVASEAVASEAVASEAVASEAVASEGLVFAGRVGTGFDQATLDELAERFRLLASDTCPFADEDAARASPGRFGGSGGSSRSSSRSGSRSGRSSTDPIHWLRPDLVCEVEFAEWTAAGHLRHPSFQGLREDKAPGEVLREDAAQSLSAPALTTAPPPPTVAAKGRVLSPARKSSKSPSSTSSAAASGGAVRVAGVAISHPDRIVYPEAGLTKADIARYYEAVAPRILPRLADRPLSLVRCPGGREDCFYQKHIDDAFPAAVGRVQVGDEDGEPEVYATVEDTEGLVSLVQMGVLEFHPWGARRDRLDRPDRLTFDLDPGPGVDWPRVAEAAHLLHQLLDHLGLRSFVKTTGGKGLHVVVPIDRRTPWDEAKAFTRAAAETLARAAPDRFVATASKAKRQGKIFIDYLRNARGATSVAAYSTRARPGAPVSMPIAWDEVDDADPAGWTVANARQRIAAQKGDPWAEVAEVRQSLTQDRLKMLAAAARS